ncbi:MAG: hypothetical protein KatS3mg038_1007 [Candidatus Kapaibacterium sp.]|nr:MAG: hypothetical protein KatS3mg038_1007 [Candidatus Kapabacteria bacterium]
MRKQVLDTIRALARAVRAVSDAATLRDFSKVWTSQFMPALDKFAFAHRDLEPAIKLAISAVEKLSAPAFC